MSSNTTTEDEIKAFNIQNLLIISFQDLIRYTISILKKSFFYRTEKEIEILKEYIKKSPFLKELSSKFGGYIDDELCHRLEYKLYSVGQVVITAGMIPQSAYILIQGSIQVTSQNNTKSVPSLKSVTPDDDLENKRETVFGRDSLDNSNPKPEPTHIVCQEECHFAVLSKKEYNKALAFANKKELEDHVSFLSSLSIFQGWPSHLLKPWAELFDKKETYPRKHVIYKQGEQSKRIYILRSGNVIYNKTISIQVESKEEHQVGIDELNQVFLMDKELVNKKADLVVLGPGQVFGDEEALEAYIQFKAHEDSKAKNEKKSSKARRMGTAIELSNLEDISIKRKITVIVDSLKAEIWSIPIGLFFSNLELYPAEFQNILTKIFVKKSRRDEQIADVIKSSESYVEYLQPQKISTLKQDISIIIKRKKLDRLISEGLQTYNCSPDKSFDSPPPTQSRSRLENYIADTQGFLTTVENTHQINDLSYVVSTSNSVSKSPVKEECITQNIHDHMRDLETRNSSITTSWSPTRKSGQGNIFLRRKTKRELQASKKERPQELKAEKSQQDKGKSGGSFYNIKPENNSNLAEVNEIRNSNAYTIFDSRTSYINYTVEKKVNIHQKLNQRVYHRPGTHHFIDIGIRDIKTKGVREIRPQGTRAASANKNASRGDKLSLFVSLTKKKPKPESPVINPLIKIKGGVNYRDDEIYTSIKQHKQTYDAEPLNMTFMKNISAFNDKVNCESSDTFFDADESAHRVNTMGNLQCSIILGGRNSIDHAHQREEELNKSEAVNNRKYIANSVFPNFKVKSVIRKTPDPNVKYIQDLKKEAERSICKFYKGDSRRNSVKGDLEGVRENKANKSSMDINIELSRENSRNLKYYRPENANLNRSFKHPMNRSNYTK